MTVKSPLKWVGGKYYAAHRIVAAFPPAREYDTYVETCGGAAHVLFAKAPARHHKEVYSDLNGDLVNFWLQARDHARELADRLRTLPYARAVYYHYYRSLFDGSEIDPFERAVRWFYVLRGTSTGWIRPSPVGWNHMDTSISAYRSVVESFEAVQSRMSGVLIDNRSFERTLEIYDSPRTLFYVDPPYIDAESYYNTGDFDHEYLAQMLNNVQGKVCLSYYPHEHLKSWYPADRWHRQTWHQQKRSSIQHCEKLLDATEVLLCNYTQQESLWSL